MADETKAPETTEQGTAPEGEAQTTEQGTAPEGSTEDAPEAPEAHEPINATEAAIELAKENNIDVATVEGTGKDGKIGKPDVQAVLDAAKPKAPKVEPLPFEAEAREVAKTNKVTTLYGVPRKDIRDHVDFFTHPADARSQFRSQQTQVITYSFPELKTA